MIKKYIRKSIEKLVFSPHVVDGDDRCPCCGRKMYDDFSAQWHNIQSCHYNNKPAVADNFESA